MALVFIDGFDALNTSATINRKYYPNIGGSLPANGLTTGRYGGLCVQNNQWIQTNLFTAQTTWVVGFALYRPQPLSPNVPSSQILGFSYQISGEQCWLAMSQNETLEFWGDGPGTVERLLGQGTIPVRINRWYYIEVKVTIDSTVGAVEVRVGGITDIKLTGVNTVATDPLNPGHGNNLANNFLFFPDFSYGGFITISSGVLSANFNGPPLYYDDIYICDTTGSFNNDFLGDQRIQTLFATGAGAHTDWSPSSGANYTDINEVNVDDDSSYVSSSSTGNIDTYAFGSTTLPKVSAIAVNLISRYDDAGPHSVAPDLYISSTDYVGVT
jgi:hypothetical protein